MTGASRSTRPGEGQQGLFDLDELSVESDGIDAVDERPRVSRVRRPSTGRRAATVAPGVQQLAVEDSAPVADLSATDIATVLELPPPTAEQTTVIEAPLSPLLVVAGAGSGKTETMAARVVWLVARGLVQPEEVLGLTFTRKAAGELSERLRRRLRSLAARGLGPGLDDGEPTVGTYHSYAAGIVADHAVRLGVEPSARLLGEAASWQLADQVVQAWDGPMDAVRQSLATVTEAVLALAGECAEHLLDPADVTEWLTDFDARIRALPADDAGGAPAPPRAPVRDVLADLAGRRQVLPIVADYVRRKRDAEVLDFGDQVALAARVATGVPSVGAGERARYRVVLLDEYQDTSVAQLRLLQTLYGGGHPVTAVGDPHQSIYGWRGAGAGNLERFPTDFPRRIPGGTEEPAPVAHLSTSWRNDVEVLTAANAVAAPLAARTDQVPPLSPRPGADAGSVHVSVHTDALAEARDLAARLAAARAETPGATSAVLCRKRSQFAVLEQELREAGVPVQVVGLGGLLHVPAVVDLVAALQCAHDPSRGDAAARLLTGARWRVSAPDLEALGQWARELGRRHAPPRQRGVRSEPGEVPPAPDPVMETGLLDAVEELPPPGWTGPEGQWLSDLARDRIARFADVLRHIRSRTGSGLAELVSETERALLLHVEVPSRPGADHATARADLDAFADVAAQFSDTADHPTLGAFLAWLQAAQDTERGLDPAAVEPDPDAVQLLTVHAAKGLEWDVVAVPGLVEGTFPAGVSSARAAGSPDTGSGWLTGLSGVPYPLRGDASGLPTWGWTAAGDQKAVEGSRRRFKEDCGAHEVREERRLAYVAVTRARSRLLLSGAWWGEGKRPRRPSRFLLEVADAVGTDRADWAPEPVEGEENVSELVSRSAVWPVDPLGRRRPSLTAAATAVHAAMTAPDGPAGVDTAAPQGSWAREAADLLDERDGDRGGGMVVDLPAHLSASRLVRLAQNPAALAVDLRRPVPVRPREETRRGTAFHAWVERRFGGASLVDVDDLPGAGEDLWGDDETLEAGGAGLTELQETFLASPWASRRPVAIEVDVETTVAGTRLRGRIDAVFREEPDASRAFGPPRWEVVDWKTGRPPTGATGLAQSVQLAVYRLAWSRLQGVPLDRVGAAFFYAATGETVRPVDVLDEGGLTTLIASVSEVE